MTARYRVDPNTSHFEVQAFATGMLSAFAHSPTFAVSDFTGVAWLDGAGVEGLHVELTVRADSLDLLDRVKPADREEIVGRMRREVLETARFPQIVFRTVEVAGEPAGEDRYRVFLGGRLTLHGTTQPLGSDAELIVAPDRLRLRGACQLRTSAYGIRPVTALAGAIRLKDELRVSFDLVSLPEGS
jgi:polyisoprenoid-binding protein YceI